MNGASAGVIRKSIAPKANPASVQQTGMSPLQISRPPSQPAAPDNRQAMADQARATQKQAVDAAERGRLAQEAANRPPQWMPPQPQAAPAAPGLSPPPLPVPALSMGGGQQQSGPEVGWDQSGDATIAPGLGQRQLPSSMSALASAARLY